MRHELQTRPNIDCCNDSKGFVQLYRGKRELNAYPSEKNSKAKMKLSNWVNSYHLHIRHIANHHTQRIDQIPIDRIPLRPTSKQIAVSSTADYPTSVV